MGDYSPYHFSIQNNTQENAKIQDVSTGMWNPNLPSEIAPFESASATCTGSGGSKGSFTIHYRSDVDFECTFDSFVSPPTFSYTKSGSNTYNYVIDPSSPVPIIVGDGVKVSFSIADPQKK